MRASVGRPMTAFVLTLLERFDESRAILDRLVGAAREYGDRSAAGVFLAERAWTRYRAGDAEGAEADASEALADRTRRHACPGPRADCGIRRRPRGHGAGAALRGAGGHRGRPAAGRRPGHRGPGRPRPRTRLADARPGRRARRRRSRARAGPRRLLGLRLANAPSVALRCVGRADTARRGGAGARACPGGAAAGRSSWERRARWASRSAPSRWRGRPRSARPGSRPRWPRWRTAPPASSSRA